MDPLQVLPAGQTLESIGQWSMFWRPAYLEMSGWLEHIPFAFWLMEAHRPRVLVELGTHYGVSYFAFCQAVETLGLDTRCYAVDTWKGDAQSGLYDESVFDKVRSHSDARYSGFSELVRSTFDEAQGYFPEGAIDLLHMDGCHTYDAVRHDFETWLPRLSRRAVVLIHDTNVRERQFGAYEYFDSLRGKYPTFEFVHGHGLGVVAVGPERSELLGRLLDGSGNALFGQAVREVFSRLGRACADAYASDQYRNRARELETQICGCREQVEALAARDRERADTEMKLQIQIGRSDAEKQQLSERVGLLQETRVELREGLRQLQSRSEAMTAEFDACRKQLLRVERESVQCRNELAAIERKYDMERQSLCQAVETLNREKDSLVEKTKLQERDLDDRFRELAALTRMLEEKDRSIEALEKETEGLRREIPGVRAARWGRTANPLRRWIGPLAEKLKGNTLEKQSALIRGSGLLDESWYLRQYPDVGAGNMDPVRHYIEHGASEGRNPSEGFDTGYYLKNNPDVRRSGQNPLVHYIRYGRKEGRSPADGKGL